MALDKENSDRSYLFGRLLAIADIAELREYDKTETKRTTNAKKYWSVYAKRPSSTLELIRKRLNPYLEKKDIGLKEWCENLIADIVVEIEKTNGYNNKPLSEMYVLGYYCQRAELNTNNKKEKTEEEGNE